MFTDTVTGWVALSERVRQDSNANFKNQVWESFNLLLIKFISASSPINPKQQKRISSSNPKNRTRQATLDVLPKGTLAQEGRRRWCKYMRGGVGGVIRHRWDTCG